jgi:hypothetical protein
MKIFYYSAISKLAIITSLLAVTTMASANTELCLKKEISNDGINWHDANSEIEAVIITDVAHFRFSAFKCPESWGGLKDITLNDAQLNIYTQPMDNLSAEEGDFTPSVWSTEVFNYCDRYDGTIENIASVEGYSMISNTVRYADDNAWASCEPTLIIGGDGCTPGYWRQDHHLDSWPVDPMMLFSDVFDREITIRIKRKNTITEPTLLEAVAAHGGSVNIAARHAVAAYLNSLNGEVNYDMTPEAVIAGFQYSFDNDDYGDVIENLVNFNEQGCPLN